MEKHEIICLLTYILEHPEEVNREITYIRPAKYTQALSYAVMVLPTEKERKVIGYLVENGAARFYFGGTDAVAPAIRHAIQILEGMSFRKLKKMAA